MAALDELVTHHPQSAHYDEAQFRRGEVFFSAQRYADAERAYAAVLALGPAVRILRAGALQARLVAVQAVARRCDEQRDVPAAARPVLVQDGQLRAAVAT